MNNLDQHTLQLWHDNASKLPWFKQWQTVAIDQGLNTRWFIGGQINASYVCLDHQLAMGRSSHIAIKWLNEQNDQQILSYQELYKEVNQFAHYLHALGIKQNDVVAIYLPMIPQAVIALLAVARLGAIHTVIFSGYGIGALQDRITESKATFVITTHSGYYRGKQLPLLENCLAAVQENPFIKKIIVMERSSAPTTEISTSSVVYYHKSKVSDAFVEPVAVDANHPLFILYTSGTTGKPKGIVHSTGGYLTYVYTTMSTAFGITDHDVLWCTADIGWITGHSYGIYGPLMHGATIVMREGAPDYPDRSAWWQTIEQQKVSIFYTSPTALRMLMKMSDDLLDTYSFEYLRVLGSVGEPLNPEVWLWYANRVGTGRCPVIDTWWQTETGGFMIAPTIAGHTPAKPGSAQFPLPGIEAAIVDEDGNDVPENTKGFLIITKPWPGMALGIYQDETGFERIYGTKFKGMYYSGDYAVRDADGYFWLLGRADEVLKVAGHRIGTAEIESLLVEHETVADVAAIGVIDEIKGEIIVLVVVTKYNVEQNDALTTTLINVVRKNMGAFASPQRIYYVPALPKTRSGKIMRRALKAMIEGTAVGDLSTLENSEVLETLGKKDNTN